MKKQYERVSLKIKWLVKGSILMLSPPRIGDGDNYLGDIDNELLGIGSIGDLM